MKFQFGTSKEWRMIRQSSWHKWFAWWPVRMEYRDGRGYGEVRWLESVGRRFVNPCWQYRPADEVLEKPSVIGQIIREIKQ